MKLPLLGIAVVLAIPLTWYLASISPQTIAFFAIVANLVACVVVVAKCCFECVIGIRAGDFSRSLSGPLAITLMLLAFPLVGPIYQSIDHVRLYFGESHYRRLAAENQRANPDQPLSAMLKWREISGEYIWLVFDNTGRVADGDSLSKWAESNFSIIHRAIDSGCICSLRTMKQPFYLVYIDCPI